jgi:hypothetical protein
MRAAVWYFSAVAVLAISCVAQDADHDAGMSGQGQSGQTMQPMHGMNMGETASSMPSFHASSGTGWQPASVPDNIWMISRGKWDLMLHGTVFATYNQQGGPRGAGKA